MLKVLKLSYIKGQRNIKVGHIVSYRESNSLNRVSFYIGTYIISLFYNNGRISDLVGPLALSYTK